MFRYGFAAFLVLACASVGSHPQTSAQSAPVTFNKDVLPILQKNCQTCHRPGQMAPMSLVTFRDARPWARAMKSKVESRQMPPWFADPAHGEFANDRSLSTREIEILRLLGEGNSLTEIAQAIGVAYKTVANTCSIIKSKLGVERTADLIRLSMELK